MHVITSVQSTLLGVSVLDVKEKGEAGLAVLMLSEGTGYQHASHCLVKIQLATRTSLLGAKCLSSKM